MKRNLIILGYYLICLMASAFFVFHVVNLSLGSTAYRVSINHSAYPIVFNVFAQGWGFFTIDTSREHIALYCQDQNGKMVEFDLRNSKFKYAFGLNKENRIIYHSFYQLKDLIPDTFYTRTKNILIHDKNNLTKYPPEELIYNIKANKFPFHIEKGMYSLSVYKTMPWLWYSKQDKSIETPGKYVYLNIN